MVFKVYVVFELQVYISVLGFFFLNLMSEFFILVFGSLSFRRHQKNMERFQMSPNNFFNKINSLFCFTLYIISFFSSVQIHSLQQQVDCSQTSVDNLVLNINTSEVILQDQMYDIQSLDLLALRIFYIFYLPSMKVYIQCVCPCLCLKAAETKKGRSPSFCKHSVT